MSEKILGGVTIFLFTIVMTTLVFVFALYSDFGNIQYSLGENNASIENIERDISELKDLFTGTTNVLLET